MGLGKFDCLEMLQIGRGVKLGGREEKVRGQWQPGSAMVVAFLGALGGGLFRW